MKKILLSTLCCGAAFCAGLMVGQPKDYQHLKEANAFKYEVLEQYDSLMKLSDFIMDQNGLWDADGSDEMCDYLDIHDKIDSLYNTQQ